MKITEKTKITEISDISFAKYGKLFVKNSGIPDSFDEKSSYWHNIQKDNLKTQNITVGYLSINEQPPDSNIFDITEMERHVRFGEIFITVSGEGILPVCNKSDVPCKNNIEFYRVKTGDAFLIYDGVWHIPPIARNCGEINFIMIVPDDILNDIDKKQIV